jgi:hypothetical protein
MLDFPNSIKDCITEVEVDSNYTGLLLPGAIGVPPVEVESTVKKTENIPDLRAPASFIDFMNKGPLFCYGEINYLPNPIIPYFADYKILLSCVLKTYISSLLFKRKEHEPIN